MDLFAYGTLLVPAVIEAVTGQTFTRLDAVLPDYARYGLVGASYPGLVPEPGAQTAGALYLDIDPESWERLDAFEGDEYERVEVWVEGTGRVGPARSYVLRPPHRDRLTGMDWDLNRFVEFQLSTFLGTCGNVKSQGSRPIAKPGGGLAVTDKALLTECRRPPHPSPAPRPGI